MININFIKNLVLFPKRIKKISAVTHNAYKELNYISEINKEILSKLLELQRENNSLRVKTKKILILGTSNSLFQGGWVTGFAQVLKDYQIINMSVGASQGFQFVGVGSREDFSQYDYVFFDSVPNEESYYLGVEAKRYEYSEMENRLLYELMSTISSQTQLIVMGFCNNYTFENESKIFKSRRQIAQNVGGYFIDIRKILLLYSKIHHLNIDDIYESVSHPKREISCEIGKSLANILSTIEINKIKYPINYSKNFYSQFIMLSKAKKSYKNSIMSFDVSMITQESSIELKNNVRCIGFYLNAVKTHCYIDCLYQGQPIQQIGLLYTVYNNQYTEKFQKIFVGLQDFPILDKLKIIRNETDFTNLYFPLITHRQELLSSFKALELSEVLYWNDKNSLDPYSKDIFSYDESMLLTYRIINSIIG